MRGDCGFSLKPKPKGRPVKMDTSLKSLRKKCECSTYYRQIKIATSLKSLRKKNMIAVLTKFKLNVLWQVASFACTKSHHSCCRNCSVIVEVLCLSNYSLLF